MPRSKHQQEATARHIETHLTSKYTMKTGYEAEVAITKAFTYIYKKAHGISEYRALTKEQKEHVAAAVKNFIAENREYQ